MIQGTIFDIQHFCVDDGPGIRTTVFLKGCPLSCLWCHNAEGISGKKQLAFQRENCVLCGACVTACPAACHKVAEKHEICFSQCLACGACTRACPTEALKIYGKMMTVDAVMERVLLDRPFFESSGGGVTLSGGEPLYQAEFALALMESIKNEGLHLCVETSGFCSRAVMNRAAYYTDLFLFDIKHTDPAMHKKLTGQDNAGIMENLQLLSELDKKVVLRCPLIPGCNDTEEHYLAVAELSCRMKNIMEIQLLPYHPFGLDKFYALGLEPGYQNQELMSQTSAELACHMIQKHTKTPVKVV